MWYKGIIESQATRENDFSFTVTQALMAAGAIRLWAYFDSTVRADVDATARGTRPLADAEARSVVHEGKARFFEDAPAAMCRWKDQSGATPEAKSKQRTLIPSSAKQKKPIWKPALFHEGSQLPFQPCVSRQLTDRRLVAGWPE